ncbi:MAG: GtrA family protein [Nitrososphaerota archaeon]|jgi:putative flippase GtrA|nr:GtrA family protein [Nitrososphaerota archaeon]
MKQLLKFIAVGVLNSMLGYSVIFGCMYLGKMAPGTSNVAGYAVGLTVSYILNRRYTFNSKKSRRAEITRFMAVFLIAYALNLLVLLAMIHRFKMNADISQILSGVVYIAAAFIMNKYYVFQAIDGGGDA